jgi:hypothetical protein
MLDEAFVFFYPLINMWKTITTLCLTLLCGVGATPLGVTKLGNDDTLQPLFKCIGACNV